MKKIFIATIFLLSQFAVADHHEEMQGKTFEEKKSHHLKNLESRISHLNEMKSCISSAKDESGLKSCKGKMKSHKKKMKNEWDKMKSKMK